MAAQQINEGRSSTEVLPGNCTDSSVLPNFWPDTLQNVARTVEVKKGALLFRRGDKAKGVYWVKRGQLQLQRHAPDGGEIILHRAREGDYLAEASLSAKFYHCDALCTEAAELILLPAPALVACIRQDPDFAMVWTVALSRNLRAVRMRLERSSLKNARDRILHYLVSEGGEKGCVTLSQPMVSWAAELGIAHETLYRTLADMEKSGVIERHERTICHA